MADIKNPEDRSKNMAAIKRADTKPELYIRRLLFSNGYRYRLQQKSIPGHPDLWLKKYNTAIFIHGCFWHRHQGCKYSYTPKSHSDFWGEKFTKNIERDKIVKEQLEINNIRCLIIWECTIKDAVKNTWRQNALLEDIVHFLNSDIVYSEL